MVALTKPTVGGSIDVWGPIVNNALDALNAGKLEGVGTTNIALGGASSAANAHIYVGAGTGTLTDDPVMGLKVKLDTTTSTSPAGVHVNVKAINNTAVGNVLGLVSRVDVNDATANTGAAVGLWGDVFVHAASSRDTFGTNTYVSIDSGSGYLGVAVGAEVAVANNAAAAQVGGLLHLISSGTNTVRFGLKMGGVAGSTYEVENSILLSSSSPPVTNAVYYGPVSAGNVPSGTALFRVAAAGDAFFGRTAEFGAALGATDTVVTIKRTGEAFPPLKLGYGAVIHFGNAAADTDASIRRGGAGIMAATDALWVGTATGAGGGYFQLWEQSAAPGAASTNSCRLFAQDNGSGKTQLCVRFPTGAVQVISTEP